MSAIDVQNAKQIRDPMDVLITLSLGTDIAMTYSGYSSAKVADGVLNQSSWPMRGLADLQGNGFPLDGSRVLYNPNTSPSQTNGKLGVRGNVGQPVSVTATGNGTIAALAISVTGAASVTLNGETTEITGSHVTLQLLNTTAALTFQPSSEDRRVEIITVLPEADFVINNDNLIKATVSLRSDLSIVDPTLPESELNVEVYQDEDVSEAVASIPEDTPITYQAGYPGDMSPVRKFYVSGQVTWADNVLSIHAVDAVHFLEIEVPRLTIPSNYLSNIRQLLKFLYITLQNSNFDVVANYPPWGQFYDYEDFINDNRWTRVGMTAENITVRDLIAFLANMIRYRNIDQRYLYDLDLGRNFIIDYVDAGAPTLRTAPGGPAQKTWAVREEDCASVLKKIDSQISALRMDTNTVRGISDLAINEGSAVVGTARWVKGGGIFLEFNTFCHDFCIPIRSSILSNPNDFYWTPLAPVTTYGSEITYQVGIKEGSPFHDPEDNYEWDYLVENGIPNGTLTSRVSIGDTDYKGTVYTSFIPWSAKYLRAYSSYPYFSMAAMWNALVKAKVIPADAKEWSCDIRGPVVNIEARTVTVGDGNEDAAENLTPVLLGSVYASTRDDGPGVFELFPTESMKNLLNRSPITCSFTWKGDPRIQPRDVFAFHRLDGTDEEWTFENITTTHEGGGTLAEVTARKGIV